MTQPPICLACGQRMPGKRLLCANCLEPIGKRDSWHHDPHSRAVHRDCSMPLGVPKLKQEFKEKP